MMAHNVLEIVFQCFHR